MTISSDRMFRLLLLTFCVGLWAMALPTFARGIVGPALTRDLVTAGSVSVAFLFHTLGLILLGAIFERSRHPWPLRP